MTSTNAQDVIAVLGEDFEQVFEDARVIKVSIGVGSKLMEHPLETGATIVDHRVLLPVTAELSIIIASANYRAVYKEIRELFTRGALLTVQTDADSYPSMLIEKMPHEETGDMFDAIAVALSLKEAHFVEPQYSTLPPAKVARPKDADTKDRGQQQPVEEKKGSILSKAFK